MLDALLRDDPANGDARKLRDALPQQVAEALRSALGRDDLDAASALAAAAATDYANDNAIAVLVAEVRKRADARTAELGVRAREQRIASLLQKRPLTGDNAAETAREILALRNERNTAAERYEQQLADVLADDVRNAVNVENADGSLAAIRATTTALSGSRPLAAIYAEAEARVVALQKERDAEVEAQKGMLVINALPWGYVDQVLDAARKPVELPQERTTPLQLSLPAGSYYVTLRHPKSSKTVSAFARVQARQRSQTSGSFPTLSAESTSRMRACRSTAVWFSSRWPHRRRWPLEGRLFARPRSRARWSLGRSGALHGQCAGRKCATSATLASLWTTIRSVRAATLCGPRRAASGQLRRSVALLGPGREPRVRDRECAAGGRRTTRADRLRQCAGKRKQTSHDTGADDPERRARSGNEATRATAIRRADQASGASDPDSDNAGQTTGCGRTTPDRIGSRGSVAPSAPSVSGRSLRRGAAAQRAARERSASRMAHADPACGRCLPAFATRRQRTSRRRRNRATGGQ